MESATALHHIETLTLFVGDVHAARTFYEAVFDASLLVHDDESAAYTAGNLQVDLLLASSAHQLIDPAHVA